MKTDVEIRQDVFSFVKVSQIKEYISGEVRLIPRSAKSKVEDCVISVQDSDVAQIQDGYVNVNVYVPNMVSGGESVENVPRTKLLSAICKTILRSFYIDGDWYHLVKQRILPVQGKDEHVINNKIKFHLNNE